MSMTIAIQPTHANHVRSQRSWVPVVKGLKRVWWHTSALVPIVTILFLVLASLIFLQLHWLYQNLISPFQSEK